MQSVFGEQLKGIWLREFKAPSQKLSPLWLLCYKWIPLGCHSPITVTQEHVMTLLTQREGMDAFPPTSCFCQGLNQSTSQVYKRAVISGRSRWSWNMQSRVPLSLTTVFSIVSNDQNKAGIADPGGAGVQACSLKGTVAFFLFSLCDHPLVQLPHWRLKLSGTATPTNSLTATSWEPLNLRYSLISDP